ncbi:Type I inositol polyphosphate 5-phosphatase 10 [Linum grandiflorum]
MKMANKDHRKRSFLQKIFSSREINARRRSTRDTFKSPETQAASAVEALFTNHLDLQMPNHQTAEPFRIFVATWNVGGKSPHSGLNLDDILQVHNQADIYVLGFQEIVPLNAGNVLVAEDNEPAAKWLALINRSLNKPYDVVGSKPFASLATPLPFQKPSLRKTCKSFRTESVRRLKTCNCSFAMDRRHNKDFCLWCPQTNLGDDGFSSDEDEDGLNSYGSSEIVAAANGGNQLRYSLIVGKQMVGIFVTVWMKKELVQHVGHLRVSYISRGIMGCLGNKGCISVSMSFHQTTFCFICSHLASGEKEGDELRRNLDVIEILKNTQFPRICKSPFSNLPERIIQHDRIIWLGDLNYRIALNYSETRKLLIRNDWNALFDKDQLKIERDKGRVFKGWKEGKIYFAPTYKYSWNSDIYAGEALDSKNKRRTPAWCDRILWHGSGMQQMSYVRKEYRFSDHRPVCATFLVDVDTVEVASRRPSSAYYNI